MEQRYAQYAVEKAVQLLAIDSPTGFTDKAAEWVLEAFASLGFDARKTTKGGILIDLGGEESAEGRLLLQAHTDTLGAMVAEVKANGRLRVTSLGGMRAENGETENVRVYTRSGKVYEGTLQLCNAGQLAEHLPQRIHFLGFTPEMRVTVSIMFWLFMRPPPRSQALRPEAP